MAREHFKTRKGKRAIYDSTGGYCHLCKTKLSFKNYARFGEKGAWEIDHSRPQALGGTDRLANLRPACISCNRQKQDTSTRAMRARSGFSRAPASRSERRHSATIKRWVVGIGVVAVGVVAFLVFWKRRPPTAQR